MVRVREGLVPTILGTAVTATGAMLRGMDMGKKHGMRREEVLPMIGAGLVGFGLAHVILGTIDLVNDGR